MNKDTSMRKTISKITLLAATFGAMSVAMPAFAEDEVKSSAITVSGGVTVVSDYRFRGVSLSNEEPTLQGTATVTHESGFYVGVWGSGLASGTDFGGTEIDIYAGWGGEVAGLKLDANVTQYTYPNQTGAGPVDYIEILSSVSKDVGPVNAKIGVGFVPKQTAFANASAFYLYNDYAIGIPSTPFTLKAHGGYNKSDFNSDTSAFDYSLGLDTTYKGLTLGVSYVNTTIKPNALKEAIGADGAVLFTLGASF
jgi:uncharacterized protein (TIGR02001 family)